MSGVGDRARSESERDKPRAVFRARGNQSQNQEYVSMAKNKFLEIKGKSLWQRKFLKIKSKFLWQSKFLKMKSKFLWRGVRL